MQPSSFDSYVQVIDKQDSRNFSYHIFMNHILTYKGYRFYQASYDKDGKGSILSVSYDPGMYLTYLGYILFSIGFLLSAFYKKGQFALNIKKLKKSGLFILFFALLFSYNAQAFNLKVYANKSKGAAEEFSKILTQKNGRIEPMDTLNLDIVHKLTSKSSLLGLNYNQIIAGMIAYPNEFQKLPLIFVSNPKIRKIIKIKGKYASYDDFLSKNTVSEFSKEVIKALHTPDSSRTQTERDWIKLNELVYISYLVYTSDIFKIFPLPDSKNQNYRWYSPLDIAKLSQTGAINKGLAKRYIKIYGSLIEALQEFDSIKTRDLKDTIYKIQKRYSNPITIGQKKIKWEIIYNHLQIFAKLIGIYSLIGLIAIFLGFMEILKEKKYYKTEKALLFLGISALLIQSLNMILRWYIAGHAPWSDAYESIIFIAWGSAFASVSLFRKSSLSLGSGLFAAGMFMMVANLNNINPQITNIVPVLDSYWLLIHVAFSIMSYGFLAVGAMLGFLNLILYALKNTRPLKKRIEQFNSIIYIYLYIGLALLSIGTIFGAVWANESWGAYWSWDPKETWSLISILAYAFVLHKNIMYKSDNEFIFPFLAFLSFFFVLMTYFGVNFYIAQGLHSYGRGSGGYVWFYMLESGIAVWFITVISVLIKNMIQKNKGKPQTFNLE